MRASFITACNDATVRQNWDATSAYALQFKRGTASAPLPKIGSVTRLANAATQPLKQATPQRRRELLPVLCVHACVC
jgi:hypothetical protein